MTHQTPPPNQQSQPLGGPNVASDSDLIEKEWVDKAKKIIQQTKSDPRVQQEAISKFKADYMKKRYNKAIKSKG